MYLENLTARLKHVSWFLALNLNKRKNIQDENDRLQSFFLVCAWQKTNGNCFDSITVHCTLVIIYEVHVLTHSLKTLPFGLL